MSRILFIETSTSLCTTSLAENGKTIETRISETPKAQASMTAPFVKDMLDARGLTVGDCDAVCVSAGPGSYTGLRVGVSTAKGLCFAAGVPLISVNTLELLANQAFEDGVVPEGCRYIVPMIDARRMEVYAAVYAADGGQDGIRQTSGIAPAIIDAGSFSKELSEGIVLFIGDGAAKCEAVIRNENARFVQTCPKAQSMTKPAFRKLCNAEFEDTAYFEPFYLKQFVATVSNKKLF